MQEKISQIRQKALEEIQGASDLAKLNDVRIKYLGKKGELTVILRGMGSLSPEERPVVGSLVNKVRDELENKIQEAEKAFEAKAIEEKLLNENIDVTMPSKKISLGSNHPITQIINNVKDIYKIKDALKENSYDDESIYKIMGGNYIRYLKDNI